MHIYFKNDPAKFHPDPIWNDEDLGFLKTVAPTRRTKKNNNNNRMTLNE